MAQWYKNNQKLFCEEMRTLASACPLMRIEVVGPGFGINNVSTVKHESAIAHGTYILRIPDSTRQIEYGIVLLLPKNYPKKPPEMFCNDPKLPIGNIDRHIMIDGRACLGVQADISISMRWSPDSTIVGFLNDLGAPFLAWQAYYEVYQKPPPWGERSHFSQGVLEFYAELLGRTADSSVVGFMRLLARKNRPKGHEPCPCDSGRRLRECHGHRKLIYEIRERVSWQDVDHDLKVYLQGEKI